MSYLIDQNVYAIRDDKFPYKIHNIQLSIEDARKYRDKLYKKINCIDGKWDEYPIKLDIVEMKLMSPEVFNKYMQVKIIK